MYTRSYGQTLSVLRLYSLEVCVSVQERVPGCGPEFFLTFVPHLGLSESSTKFVCLPSTDGTLRRTKVREENLLRFRNPITSLLVVSKDPGSVFK